MTPDFLAVGHVSSDWIAGKNRPGGSVLYASQVAKKLGRRSAAWTVAPDSFPFPPELKVTRQTSAVATTFHLDYDSATGKRKERCMPVAPSLEAASLPGDWAQCSTVLICPIVNEVPPDLIRSFPESFLGLTPQGWFRFMDGEGKISRGPSRWTQLPRKIDLLVVSEDDIQNDPAARDWIRRESNVAVVTHGRRGHTVYFDQREKFLEPPYVAEEVDPTGAGDTFATAMLIALAEGAAPLEAAQFGSAAASFVVEQPGVSGLPTREKILKRKNGAS